jgi:alkylated DNA repair dioxygenase AlkB
MEKFSIERGERKVNPPEGLVYFPDFLNPEEEFQIRNFLNNTETISPDIYHPQKTFSFTNPIFDNIIVESRMMASAGTPIWHNNEVMSGVDIPQELAVLRDIIEDYFIEDRDTDAPYFTSVYVDSYKDGGGFVPHVDRDCYGPVVAAISVGEGSATLRFINNETGETFDFRAYPGSLYFMSGASRYDPWEHSVIDVEGHRYSVTFRNAATR